MIIESKQNNFIFGHKINSIIYLMNINEYNF